MKLNNTQFLKQLYTVSLLNLIILFFISINYINYLENFEDLLAKVYFILTTFSHFALIATIPLLLGLSFFYITKSKIVSKVVFIILSVFSILVMKLDATIFSQFRYHLSPIVFDLMFGKRASDTFQFSFTSLSMVILFIIAVVAIQFLFFFLAKKIVLRDPNLRIKNTMLFFVLALLFSHLTYAWSDVNFYRPITQYKTIYPAFYPLTAEGLMTKLNLVDAERIKRNKSFSGNISQNTVIYPTNKIISEPKSNKKNVLFLIIDSWRYDCMDSQITPNIYNLSQKSQIFQNHQSGSNMTTGGVFTLFYGIPATYFLTFTGIEKSPVFMDELQKQHYEMGILSSSTIENPPFNRNVFANIPNLRLFSNGNTPSERDIDITNEWLSKIDQRKTKEPFFGYLFFDSAHGFDYPKNYKEPFTPALDAINYLDLKDDYNPSQLINRYKNALHFVDSQFGKIIKQLEDKKLLENTIIVVTGDHGQEFNDNKKGYWNHGGNFSKYQVQTPMMIFDFSKAPKKYNHLSLHYDIVPTLMTSILGVKNQYSDYSSGQNLYDTKERDWFVCGYNQKYSVIEKNRITNIYESGLYDVLDHKLNPLKEDMNFDVIAKAFEATNKYYQKK